MIRESDHFLSVLSVVKFSQSQKKRFNAENTKGTEAWLRASS